MKQCGMFLVFLFSVNFCLMAKEWHVSNAGKAGSSGTVNAPFASLEQARNAIRNYRKQNPDAKNEVQTVIIADGSYHLDKTFRLELIDSKVTYKAANQGKVYISTAPELSADMFRKPTETEKTRLKEAAREAIIVADINDNHLHGAFGKGKGKYSLLTWNEHVMQLAQWPNHAYNHIDKVIDIGPTTRWLQTGEKAKAYSFEKPCGGKFKMIEKTDFAAWNRELQRTEDIFQEGFISVDWTEDHNRIARVSDDGIIQLLDSTLYGIGCVRYKGGFRDESHKPLIKPYRRLIFRNVLCELDMPGEWYYDRLEKKLYLWPISNDLEGVTIAIPSGEKMLELKNTDHLGFQGIVFQNGGETVLSVSAGSHNEFSGCVFRNLLGRVGDVSGGYKNGFRSCDFYNMQSCLSVSGGDYKALRRSDNYIINCDFSRFRSQGYGAISLSGCGVIFKNNIYHNITSGISYAGMYIEFVNNEFFDVGWGMGDWNVLYQGAKIWCNGNLVQNNFFHHMFEQPGRYGIRAVRNDDGGSGTKYISNIFFKTGAGAITFAGPNSQIKNNISLGHDALWATNIRPITKEGIEKEYQKIRENYESGKYPRGGKEDRIYNTEKIVGEKGWDKEPFKSAFPHFSKYMNSNPFAQSYGSMIDNYSDKVLPDDPYHAVYVHGSFFLTDDDGMVVHKNKMEAVLPKTFKYNAPVYINPKTDFVDIESLDFTLKSEFKAMPGFVACDLSKVGLYKDKFRSDPPSQKQYRSKLYKKNKFRPSQSSGVRYSPGTFDKYYPLQSWIEEMPEDLVEYPYLSRLDADIEIGHNNVLRDFSFSGKKISIGGIEFDTGIIACPVKSTGKSELVFDLKKYPKAKGFSAFIGIDDTVGKNGSCEFIVYGRRDEKWTEIYKGPRLRGKDTGIQIQVDIQGYDRLRLVTTDAGDGIGSDHSAWADAKFIE